MKSNFESSYHIASKLTNPCPIEKEDLYFFLAEIIGVVEGVCDPPPPYENIILKNIKIFLYVFIIYIKKEK